MGERRRVVLGGALRLDAPFLTHPTPHPPPPRPHPPKQAIMETVGPEDERLESIYARIEELDVS